MNKKIKIIELLNKIANKEKLPKIIKYDRFIWILGKTIDKNTDYQMENNSEQFLFSNYILSILVECLNDEVEILLEDNTEDIEEFKGETFEQLGYEVGKLSIAIAKGLEKAIKELGKDNINE